MMGLPILVPVSCPSSHRVGVGILRRFVLRPLVFYVGTRVLQPFEIHGFAVEGAEF